MQKNTNLALVALSLVAAIAVIAGFAAIPALQEAQAANCSDVAILKNKGAQGDLASKGKRQGHGGFNLNGCP